MDTRFDPDVGGGRGYSLSFSDKDSYASVRDYFLPSNQWPVTQMSFSVWMRFTASAPGAIRSFAFTMLAKNDPNQFQVILNVVQRQKSWLPNLEVYTAQVTSFAPMNIQSFASSWTHVTLTYNLTDVSIFFNGSLMSTTPGNGQSLRWADISALFLGGSFVTLGSDTTAVSGSYTEKFYGWLDDMAIYNRVLSVEEIKKNWQQVVDTTDSSLFLYYNFDEGPGSTVIKNYGSIGSQGDLYNGQILGKTKYLETSSQVTYSVTPGTFSPGVPVIGASNTLPMVFAVDAGATIRLRVACQWTSTTMTASSLIPVQAQIMTLPSGPGKIFQVDPSQTRIITPNTALTSVGAEFWYYASTNSPIVDSMQYSCVCNGATETGTINVIINPAVIADPTISLTVVAASSSTTFNLHGSLANPGLMKVNITSLPTLGYLSQWDFNQPTHITPILKPGTAVTNIINGLQYMPAEVSTGSDMFSYQLIHNGMISNVATVELALKSWDFTPIIPTSVKPFTILHRQATSVNLPVKDYQQKQYLGVYIMSLPTKGTLYQRNPDGSLGDIIDRPFQYSFTTPSVQYASKILNVSSFWGTSKLYNPIQALGPQNCFSCGDCTLAWCPSTLSGTGGFTQGCGQGICFRSDPDQNFLKYGYTEYIELGFNTSVLVNQVINGENQGMGAVKNILAKDPLGNWMTLWSNPSVDNSIEQLFYEFNQYRTNIPDICQTPFFTSHIRYEIDTRAVSDWDEFDYFELQGLATVDPSMVNWYGKAKWDVIYVPHKDASGLDSFTYSATDCPGTSRVGFAQRWSTNVGTININIVPFGTAGTIKIDADIGVTKIDLSIWSVNINSSSTSSSQINVQPFVFTIASLPPASSGFLTNSKGGYILSTPYTLPDSVAVFQPVPCCTSSTCSQAQIQKQQKRNNYTSFTYLSSDLNNNGPLTVSLALVCPYVTANVNAPVDVGVPVAIALAVVIFVAGVAYGIRQYVIQREAKRKERAAMMEKLEAAAKAAEQEARKAEADQERERRLRHELQENIVNSAHDIKSPTAALSLAVESLLDALDTDKPVTTAGRQQIIETLHGMSHTISVLTMIINRSVDASKSTGNSDRGMIPNKGLVDLEHLMDGVMAFSQWQAEDTGINVVLEPLPVDLPDEIMVDEKWLKDDLLCAVSNAVKFSRANQGEPALIRVAIVPSSTGGVHNVPTPSSVQFSFIDSGYPLSDEKLATMFDRPMHNERAQTGGMGLGLYCLREHIRALEGQYGARRRTDGREGTEIWFNFPLIIPDRDREQFVMNEKEHALTHSPQFHSGFSFRAGSSSKGNVKRYSIDRLSFSSPQNRRASTRIVRDSKSNSGDQSKNPSRVTSRLQSRSNSIGKMDVGRMGKGNDGQGEVKGDDGPELAGGIAEVAGIAVSGMDVETDVITADGDDVHDTRTRIRKKRPTRRRSSDRIQSIMGSLKMLLVDDSVSILKLTRKAIQNECTHISITEAKNGEEAFQRVLEAPTVFELIVTDVQMPICDGFEFTRKVRQLERDMGCTDHGAMIIGISANDQEKISIEAKESGMDGFMHKPFKISTLMDVIEEINDGRKQLMVQKMLSAITPRIPTDSSVDPLQNESSMNTILLDNMNPSQLNQDVPSLLEQNDVSQGLTCVEVEKNEVIESTKKPAFLPPLQKLPSEHGIGMKHNYAKVHVAEKEAEEKER